MQSSNSSDVHEKNESETAVPISELDETIVGKKITFEHYRSIGKSLFFAFIRNQYALLAVLLFFYMVLNLWMNFSVPYKNYLFSDMFGYLNRPIQIFNNDVKSYGAWVGFAPFYSRILAEPYSVMVLFGIEKYFVEFLLVLNVLMSAVSGIALYCIAKKSSGRSAVGLVLMAAYLFSYPHLYFNGFILTEPFTVPLIIFSCWLMMYWRDSYYIAVCGVLLAVAVGIRPSNGTLGLPFALYIGFSGVAIFSYSFKELVVILFPRFVKAGVFSLAFFGTLLLVVAENNRVSDGRMKGLTSHSGYNFLLGQSQAHGIFSTWDGITYVFFPASVAHHPEKGTLRTTIPIYDSDTFYDKGWELLDAYPHLWLDHFKKYKYLFFDNLFPAVPGHPGFMTFMTSFKYIVFYMFLLCGLVYISFKERDVPRSVIAFFGAAFIFPAASLYFFTVTHKYFFNFSYTVFVLFIFGCYSALKHYKRYKLFICGYLALILIGTVAFWGNHYNNIYNVTPNLKATITENDGRIYSLDQNRKPKRQAVKDIDRLEFYQHEKLQHATLGFLGFRYNFFLDVESQMEVLKKGTYTFTFYGDDGYEVYLNDSRIIQVQGPAKMANSAIKRSVILDEGTHKIKVKMYQGIGESGLAGYYRRMDENPKNTDVIWEPMNGRGTVLGEDDEYTRFHSPE